MHLEAVLIRKLIRGRVDSNQNMIQSLHGYVKLNNRSDFFKKKMENIHVPIVVLVDIYTDMYIYHSSLIFHQPYNKSVFLKISLFGK